MTDDHTKLVREAQAEALTAKNPLVQRLADAVDALVAGERELRAERLDLIEAMSTARKDRDALRLRLEGVEFQLSGDPALWPREQVLSFVRSALTPVEGEQA